MEFSVFQRGRRRIISDPRCSCLRHAAGSFRRQPTLHVCGNAKLSCLSDGFGSLQSGRQLFGLCQSLGCPGSPIVTIEIVAHQFCHVIAPAVAFPGRCAPSRWHRTSSGSAFTCASWISQHLVHRRVQCSNPERAEAICWISMCDWHWGQRGRPATRGGKLGVCGSGNGCLPLNRRERYRTLCHRWMPERCGDRSSMPTRHCDTLINIAHFPTFIERGQRRRPPKF